MYSAHDHHCMATALRLAEKGLCSTAPNPRVGCVISREGVIIGSGWHRSAGAPHAEINAVNTAAGLLAGATAYLTLEPCAHHGKTPPCCVVLVEQKIRRVVIAMQDPNPLVAGRGIAYLRRNGLQVDIGLYGAQARELNSGFISRMTRNRPWVRVKLATSIDGRTALHNGKSRWITGEAARQDVHRWRARSDCVLTGSGTVRMDDPAMNVRLPGENGDYKQPLRAIIDSRGAVAAAAKIFQHDGQVLIYTSKKTSKYDKIKNAAVIHCESASAQGKPGKIPLSWVCGHLAAAQINEVHVEAGAGLCGALLRSGLIDELLIYQAAIVLGSASQGMFRMPELVTMAEKITFTLHDARRIGDDLRTVFRAHQPAN